MGAQLASAVHLQDPDTHETVILAAGTCPEPRLAALVTNPSAWVDGKLPDDASNKDSDSGNADTKQAAPAAAKKTAAKKTAAAPARGRDAAGEGTSGD